MNYQPQSTLERLLRSCELGWMIDWYAPQDQAIPHLQAALAAATSELQLRFGPQAPKLTEARLDAEFNSNPHKVRAFFQALSATRSPHMLVMVWRILQGATVAAVSLNYKARSSFHLRVTLANPFDETQEIYESTDIKDAAMLRHFGITTVNGEPLFDGFYPLRIG